MSVMSISVGMVSDMKRNLLINARKTTGRLILCKHLSLSKSSTMEFVIGFLKEHAF